MSAADEAVTAAAAEQLAIHDRFPGAWQAWPEEARQLATELLLARALEIHEGPAGLLKFLYAGTMRDGKRVRFTMQGPEYWPLLLADLHERKAKQSAAPIAETVPAEMGA